MAVQVSFVRIAKAKQYLNYFLMKLRSLLLLLPFILFSCQHRDVQEEAPKYEVSPDFVQGSEDIPLLMDMERIYDSSIGFDTASGSIIHSNYVISGGLENAKKFYIETLPQMGWKLEEENLEKITFKRDSESLEIEFVNFNGEDIVKFFLSSSL